MATALTTAKRLRTAKQNVVTKTILLQCDFIMGKERSGSVVSKAKVMLQALSESKVEVKRLNDNVSGLLEDDAELEENEHNAFEFTIKARKVESKMIDFISNVEERKPVGSIPSIPVPSIPHEIDVKLPKLKIKTYW